MAPYIFLSTMLPEIRLGERPELSFDDFITLCKENLLPQDLQQVRVLQGYFDLLNIRNFWLGQEIDPYGSLDRNQLEDALLTGKGLAPSVYEFLDKYATKQERIDHFPELFVLYFKEAIANSKGFTKKYLIFERELRLILAAYRAYKLGRIMAEEFQYEDPEEPLIAQILAFKDAKSFEPPFAYEELKPMFEKYGDDPVAFYEDLARYRFEKIEELHGVRVFSLDRILGYIVQLILAEGWMKLDEAKGNEIAKAMIEGAK